MKYATNFKGSINLVVVAAEDFDSLSDFIFEVPDEVQQNWKINEDGNVIKPETSVDVVDENGDYVGQIVVEAESVIII